MDSILHQLSLGTLSESFSNERIDPGVALSMSDSALTDLGVNTIGDRIRLRELCTKYVSNQGQSDEDDGNAAASGTTLSGRDSVRQERSLLFQANSTAGVRSASSGRGKKRKNSCPQRTWTVQFVCLSSRFAKKTPTTTEKSMLLQAGLGCKKIKLLADDTDEDVLNKLTSDAKDEFGNTLGFPQLRTCGGFEMLQCLANCRDLSVIGTSWSVRDLKSALGGQAKIYLRPIQKNLSTRSQEPKRSESLLKEKCRWCQKPFLFSELREHSSHCTGNFFGNSDDDATDLPAVMSGRPDSSNNSTESSLNVPISVAAQQPANVHRASSLQVSQAASLQSPLQSNGTRYSSNVPGFVAAQASVDLHTASSPKYSQTTQQLPLHQDSMVAATQPANHVTSPSIQATNQQLGGEAVDDARRSISNLEDILEQVAIKSADSGNPVQMLQCLQDSVVVGRALEIVNVSESLEGDVNYILVNRYNLLETAFDEIQLIENPRLTLQVQFYGEVSNSQLLF